ncbi:MAG: 4-(cytidine 5'-diphospho)-2-C-methyl-D-erythritol kinase [Pseudomonadota bacterium]
MTFSETAYAKVNLALHVRARRADGYHAIETLFAFVDDGDVLGVDEAGRDGLAIEGEFADGLSAGPDNLVMRALALARGLGAAVPPLAIRLVKNLPVAAGLGGGSADAGAMLRLILRNWPGHLSEADLIAASAALGADVPACVAAQTVFARGIGDDLQPVDLALSGQAILLVNPLVLCPTGPVFEAWDGMDRGALDPSKWRVGRNDLVAPATMSCPEIDDVMTVLRAQLPVITRMSGSGATCFALFDGDAAMEAAANRIWDDHPDWWMMAGHLR